MATGAGLSVVIMYFSEEFKHTHHGKFTPVDRQPPITHNEWLKEIKRLKEMYG